MADPLTSNTQTAQDVQGTRINATGIRSNVDTRQVIGDATALAVGDIVYVSGRDGNRLKVALASQAAATTSFGQLLSVRTPSSPGLGGNKPLYAAEALKCGLVNFLTTGASVGDPVYLSTAGTATLTKPTTGVVRRIGTVVVVGTLAAGGAYLFDGTPPTVGTRANQSPVVSIVKALSNAAGITITAAELGGNYGGAGLMACCNTASNARYVQSAAWSGHDAVIVLSGASYTGDLTVIVTPDATDVA